MSILCVGGAPRLAVDAIRHVTVAASGQTACRLYDIFIAAGATTDLLVSQDAESRPEADRYTVRAELDAGIRDWIVAHPTGTIVLSAAINDYEVAEVRSVRGGALTTHRPGAKIPSGADELHIHLRPASKLIDQLAGWGHHGQLIAFKYEESDTVLASADRLRQRVHATAVVANSLDGSIQALVSATGARLHDSRGDLLQSLADLVLAGL